MSTQPSMVMHWNTVRMAKRMLSKLVMPKLGPVQYSLHSVPLGQILAGGSWPQDQSAAFSPGNQKHREQRGQAETRHVFQLKFSIPFKYVQIYTAVFKHSLCLKLDFSDPIAYTHVNSAQGNETLGFSLCFMAHWVLLKLKTILSTMKMNKVSKWPLATLLTFN